MTRNYHTPEATLSTAGPMRLVPRFCLGTHDPEAPPRNSRRILLVSSLIVFSVAVGCRRETAATLSYNDGNAVQLRKLLQKEQKSGAAAATSAAEPTGFATLKGKFTLTGSPPPRAPLNANKDQSVCAPGGTQPLDESVVVGPDNGIKNVLIYLSSVIPPTWEHESYAAAKTGEVSFDQKNCIFLSHVASMRATQTMRVLNSDSVGHNTNLDSKRGAAAANFIVPASTTVPANAPAYKPLKASPAPFSVSCSIHPWMKAWLMVSDSPYFAVTKEDGSFEIQNIPAGVPLDFRVWQEKAGYVQSVNVGGTATQWKRGKFTLTLNNGEPTDLNVTIDAAVFK